MQQSALFLLLSLSSFSFIHSSSDFDPLLPSQKKPFIQVRLAWAAWRGDVKKVWQLIEGGADPSQFFSGFLLHGTPLMIAAGKGNKGVVELLLRFQGTLETLNTRDMANRTAIRRAEREGHENIVTVLAKLPGIDVVVADYKLTRYGAWMPSGGETRHIQVPHDKHP